MNEAEVASLYRSGVSLAELGRRYRATSEQMRWALIREGAMRKCRECRRIVLAWERGRERAYPANHAPGCSVLPDRQTLLRALAEGVC